MKLTIVWALTLSNTDGSVDGATKHRNVKHKVGEEKRRRLDVEDMLALYANLDRMNVQLPVFLAANLTGIPPFAPDATDFCSLITNVELLQSQMAEVMKHFSSVRGQNGQMHAVNDNVATPTSNMVHTPSASDDFPKCILIS